MRENYNYPRRSPFRDAAYEQVKEAVAEIYRLATDEISELPRQRDYEHYYGLSGLSLRAEQPDTLRAARFQDDDVYIDMFSEHRGIVTYHSLSIRGLAYAAYSEWSRPNIGGRGTYRRKSLLSISEDKPAVACITKMRDLASEEAAADWPHRFDDGLLERARRANRLLGVRAPHIIPAVPNDHYL